MHGKLWDIRDWEARARAARYGVAELADHVGVSERTLRRFLRRRYGVAPRVWMHRLRMRQAVELLRRGDRVGEVARALSYGDGCQFARAFKAWHDSPPSMFVQQLSIQERVTRMNSVEGLTDLA